ncbi:GMC family oxidoreductase [Aspergillus undulatus]|uniref:GMC family oxidoreductase n=1 Tax=Aspergillus undulatus TaxID=1810928 RepID=UPI003CCD28FA
MLPRTSNLASYLIIGTALLGSAARAETFDYVVVGGGTAGITLAVRLAEASHKVALIEAGTYYEDSWSLAAIPGADVIPVGSDPDAKFGADWGFVTTPQAGADGREIHFARGKCLGGSPTKESMDMWADVVNDTSYSFENTLPFYKRTVNFTAPDKTSRTANATVKYNADAFDVAGGPLQVSYPNFVQSLSTWMKRGMEAIGLTETNSFNNGELFGYQFCSSTIRPDDKTRSSSQAAFIQKGRQLPDNLTLRTQHLAKKILFDGQKNAVGVEVADGFGFRSDIMASKEVIVSAGAFQSPQLLMVSGVGPADQLAEHGIDVVSDLHVGHNMWDHPFFGLSYRVNVETFTRLANDLLYLVSRFLDYTTKHTGPLTNPVADFIAFEKIPSSRRSGFSSETEESLTKFPKDWPEVEYMSGAGYLGSFSGLMNNQPKDGYQYGSILGILITPTSRGNITITSTDTSDPPIINPNWLTTESDQQAAIAIFKRIREAFASDGMAPIVIGDEYYPGNQTQTDTEILEFIRKNVMTLWHPSCTNKMGTADDPRAVIDSKARVFGVNRLRVVDASSFPFLPPGHPQSTVYMLAEKIADDIIRG